MGPVVAVVPDLFFAAKMQATARITGAGLFVVPRDRALEHCAGSLPSRLLLDLHVDGALELVRALKTDPRTATIPVTGFYSHVETARRMAALAAGVDEVLPRSAFVTRLPALLVDGPVVPAAAPRGEPALPAGTGALLEDEEEVARIVRSMRTVAVVGIKGDDRPDEPAYGIPAMLAERGVDVIGINPTIASALGRPTLPAVGALASAVDVLDVFRRIEVIPALADEVLALPAGRRPRTVWLQTGIRHDDAARRLAQAGMLVVQDRCLGVYAARYA